MPESSPTVSLPQQGLRLCGALFLLLAGTAVIALVFPLSGHERRMRAIRLWSRLFCGALGLRVVVNSPVPPDGMALIVANHISWLDIFVIDSWHPCRFVAKAEINHWPLIGWLCRHAGTLFISRERRHDTGRIRQQMVHGLARRHTLAVFPEGTTSDGRALLPFNASLLQAALDCGAPVYSVALAYRQDGAPSTAAAYIDDMSLVESLGRIVRSRGLTVEVTVAEPIAHWSQGRRELAEHCRRAIGDTLRLLD